jgi:Spy/CpxP family protein refolding chaperone
MLNKKHMTMNLTKLSIIVFISLFFMAGNTYAQRGNRTANCYFNIPNLSDKQKEQIDNLRSQHLKVMEQLREQRRSTYDMSKKEEVRNQMLQKREEHRSQVRNLLTPEQQEAYDANTYRMNNRQGRGRGNGYGRKGTGSCNQKGDGNNRQGW